MKLDSRKVYYILVAANALLVAGLLGGAYGANLLLTDRSKALVEARTKVQSLEAQQTSLAKARNDLVKYEALGKIAKSIVPQDKDQAQAVREIVTIANKAGVKLGSITFPTSTLGAKAPAAAAPAGGNQAGGGNTPAPAGPAAGAASLSQLKPVAGIAGVYDLAITVQSDSAAPASFSQFIAFLEGLESNRRTALVSGITINPDSKDPSKVSFTLNINEYIKP